eukprot:scaffold10715_cov114-Isochrysis_galbana.AAC.5
MKRSRYCRAYSSAAGSSCESLGKGERPPSSFWSKLTPRACSTLRKVTSRPHMARKASRCSKM